MNDLVIVNLNTALAALDNAKTIQEKKSILDMAEAAEIYAKRQELGKEAELRATSIRVEALRQIGEILIVSPKNTGVRMMGSTKGTGGTKIEPPSVIPTLAEMGLDKKTSKLAQDIAKLPDEQIEKVKQGVLSINQAANKPHVAHNGGENEWYTPPEYIACAVAVMGRIDLDPASSETANKIVRATKIYTKQDDGLSKFWAGKVWMNPPYAAELIRLFIKKFVDHVSSGDISEGIVLVNNATETNWFNELVSVASAVVFPNGRIKFIDKNGESSGAPLQGQAVIYIGKKPDKFMKEFGEFGWSAKIC